MSKKVISKEIKVINLNTGEKGYTTNLEWLEESKVWVRESDYGNVIVVKTINSIGAKLKELLGSLDEESRVELTTEFAKEYLGIEISENTNEEGK